MGRAFYSDQSLSQVQPATSYPLAQYQNFEISYMRQSLKHHIIKPGSESYVYRLFPSLQTLKEMSLKVKPKHPSINAVDTPSKSPRILPQRNIAY